MTSWPDLWRLRDSSQIEAEHQRYRHYKLIPSPHFILLIFVCRGHANSRVSGFVSLVNQQAMDPIRQTQENKVRNTHTHTYKTHTHTNTHTHTHRHTHRKTHTHTQTQKNTHTHKHRKTHTHTHTHTNTNTHTHTNTQINKYAFWYQNGSRTQASREASEELTSERTPLHLFTCRREGCLKGSLKDANSTSRPCTPHKSSLSPLFSLHRLIVTKPPGGNTTSWGTQIILCLAGMSNRDLETNIYGNMEQSNLTHLRWAGEGQRSIQTLFLDVHALGNPGHINPIGSC